MRPSQPRFRPQPGLPSSAPISMQLPPQNIELKSVRLADGTWGTFGRCTFFSYLISTLAANKSPLKVMSRNSEVIANECKLLDRAWVTLIISYLPKIVWSNEDTSLTWQKTKNIVFNKCHNVCTSSCWVPVEGLQLIDICTAYRPTNLYIVNIWWSFLGYRSVPFSRCEECHRGSG